MEPVVQPTGCRQWVVDSANSGAADTASTLVGTSTVERKRAGPGKWGMAGMVESHGVKPDAARGHDHAH